MGTLNHVFTVLVAVSLLIGGCAALPAQAGQDEQVSRRESAYESILGKSLTDDVVADFVTSNDCSSANQFLLCQASGMAFWTDSNGTVDMVYLYLNNTDGFAPYKGELPFGLKFYDTMEAVEYKLNRQGIGNAGQPDKGATPDRMHYQATYYEAGITIIYNYPAPDEGATLRAVLVTKKNQPR